MQNDGMGWPFILSNAILQAQVATLRAQTGRVAWVYGGYTYGRAWVSIGEYRVRAMHGTGVSVLIGRDRTGVIILNDECDQSRDGREQARGRPTSHGRLH